MGNAASTASSSNEDKDVVSLSVELGALIIDHLNLKDRINLYTIEELRKFFAPRHAKSLILSRTTLATPKTLQKEFIIHMGLHIHELNLSCIKNLTPDAFTQTINQLKNLKILDVTYTNVFLHNLLEAGLPENLEELAIDFNPLGETISIWDSYWLWDICNCRNLKSIHFVAYNYADVEKTYEFFKNIPSTNGLKVKITVIRDTFNDRSDPEDELTQPRLSDTNIYFKELTLVMVDCVNLRHLNGIGGLDFKQLEYIFMMWSDQGDLIIYTSQALRLLFTASVGEKIQIKVCEKLPLFFASNRFIIKVWNKCSTSFDADFFQKVLEEFKEYLPQLVCMHCDSPKIVSVIKSESDWYCIDGDGFENKFEYLPSKITLTSTCMQQNPITGPDTVSISLSPTSSLKNITLLSINSSKDLSDNFFVVLFQCCKLQTLDIIGPLVGFDKAVQFANNLKNIRQDCDDTDVEVLFANLSKCPSLENIHICDNGGFEDIEKNKMTLITINLISIIANCKELHSLFIESSFAANNLNPVYPCIAHLANDYTSVVFCESLSQHNPFANVFAPSEVIDSIWYI